MTEAILLSLITIALLAVAMFGDKYSQGIGGRHNTRERETMRYEAGAADPTAGEGDPLCMKYDESQVWHCTWSIGHEHPQHVAGDGSHVLEVWDAEPDLHIVYKVGDPDPTPDDVENQCPHTTRVDTGNGSLEEVQCDWERGHAHPQHVAVLSDEENDWRYRVVAAWPRA